MVATDAKGGDFGGREDLFDDICSLEVETPTDLRKHSMADRCRSAFQAHQTTNPFASESETMLL